MCPHFYHLIWILMLAFKTYLHCYMFGLLLLQYTSITDNRTLQTYMFYIKRVFFLKWNKKHTSWDHSKYMFLCIWKHLMQIKMADLRMKEKFSLIFLLLQQFLGCRGRCWWCRGRWRWQQRCTPRGRWSTCGCPPSSSGRQQDISVHSHFKSPV